ncbi:MAG TPA: NAD-dependent epimerase/dehydratase family protein [Ornithinibacter sp.]|nr:NAD-dependent epimerase/dehydratase family protein [Ornithinibacter sp.]
MRMLVLGGTAWLGRTVAQVALDRGHDVTCLARGSADPPTGAMFVTADRDHDDGLAPVAGEQWDAVVDVTRHPGHARRAVRDLRAAHRVLVSTGNVYASFDTLEQGEDSPLRAPLDGDLMADMEVYGEAKVACERAVRGAAGTATIARSGLIGGPGDWSGRTGYWPWRFAHPVGEHVVVPDELDFPCAVIDVRDLADWLVTAGEQQLDGTFNATGPTTPLHEVLAASARVAGSTATPLPVARERLTELGVGAWMGPASLPLWIDDADWRGFATMDTTRARAAGLLTRPLEETLRDTLAFEEARTVPRRAGLTDDDERRVQEAVLSR